MFWWQVDTIVLMDAYISLRSFSAPVHKYVLTYITKLGVKWHNHRIASLIFEWYLRGGFYIKLSFYLACVLTSLIHKICCQLLGRVRCCSVTVSQAVLENRSLLVAWVWAYLYITVRFSMSLLLKLVLLSLWYIYSCLFECQLWSGCVTARIFCTWT